MAGESTNWLSFSLSSAPMESRLESAMKMAAFQASSLDDSRLYYPFADNPYPYDYFAGCPSDCKPQTMLKNHQIKENDSSIFTSLLDLSQVHQSMQQQPKLEDFFAGGDSAETQDSSSLTHIYDHHLTSNACANVRNGEERDLKIVAGFQAFSTKSSSEVDDSAFTQSPVESEFVAYSQIPIKDTEKNSEGAIVVNPESCKKIGETFGQRTSIYRGVTKHRWTGRYEAHLWDNSCRREGQARKGRQVYLGGYDKEEKAARAYDLAALKYWGSTATTNFPISNYYKELEEMKHVTKQEFIASLRRKSSGFSRGASIYRGVTRHHQQGRWQARIGRVAGNKDLYLGTFATEEEAAEAYDIAAIKFRGANAVTNFEMSRYDIEAIGNSSLPIGGTSKRLKLSLEGEEQLPPAVPSSTLRAPSRNSLSFPSASTPCEVPFNTITTPYDHHNLFHHFTNPNASDSIATISPIPYFDWPHHPYY
ncbi:AP2-like ethylene-responsive transcription factor AIL7 [Primulina tabacum]|uniref:AP2-like ethylene-responsive transcription factor AIL7 n=1 Tax=Primulina tabacum TaxID=48773 RepID=UPI003F59F2D9